MNSKGTILTLVLVFIIILSISGMVFLYISSSQKIVTISEINRIRSLYLAEAGVERSVSWLVYSSSVPETNYNGYGRLFVPFSGNQYLGPDGGYYRVIIYPDLQNQSFPNYPMQLYYTVSSTGTIGIFSKCVDKRVKINKSSTTVDVEQIYWKEFPTNRL